MQKIVPRFIEYIVEADKTWQERGEYYKAAAGILPICTTTGRLLLFLRKFVEGDPDSGKWSLAGGMMNEKELEMNVNVGSRECALREFTEETGSTDVFDRIMASYVYASPDSSFHYYNFIGLVTEEFEPKLNEEHTDCKWFSVADLKLIPRDEFHFGVKLLFANDENNIKKYTK